jgi:hypothetical protein
MNERVKKREKDEEGRERWRRKKRGEKEGKLVWGKDWLFMPARKMPSDLAWECVCLQGYWSI